MISNVKIVPTKKLFGISKMMKGCAHAQEGQPQQRKNRVGSLFKRFVAHIVAKERGVGEPTDTRPYPLLWKKPLKQPDSSDDSEREMKLPGLAQHPPPEILKVSPMCTSCEVTLISCAEDGPGTHQITVTHDGKKEPDDSYHMVLNPHRTHRKDYYDDDDDDAADNDDDDNHDFGEIGSSAVTHDMTTDSCSSDLNGNVGGNDRATAQSFIASVDNEEAYYSRESYDGCLLDSDQQYISDTQNVMIKKESIFYKSLFVVSDSEDDDDDGDDYYNFRNDNTITEEVQYFVATDSEDIDHDGDDDYQKCRNKTQTEVRCFVAGNSEDDDDDDYRNCRNTACKEVRSYNKASKPCASAEQKKFLNTTFDTALLEDDEESLSSRDEDLPIEIIVRTISQEV